VWKHFSQMFSGRAVATASRTPDHRARPHCAAIVRFVLVRVDTELLHEAGVVSLKPLLRNLAASDPVEVSAG
jgi:hypothetical protein